MRRIITSTLLGLAASMPLLADQAADYPGGQQALLSFLVENLQYPPRAIDNGIEGRVLVNFQVNTDGSISEIRIMHPIDPDLEAEAIRMVKAMPLWTPATDDAGRPVVSRVTLPVNFSL